VAIHHRQRHLDECVTCELALIPLAEGLFYARAARLPLREGTGISYIANAASCCAP